MNRAFASTRTVSAVLPLTLFLVVFFAVWTLRATWLFAMDESIASPVAKAAYGAAVKMVLWVLPAIAFARLIRRAAPGRYLGLAVWPSWRQWGTCLGVSAGFLLLVALGEWLAGRKSFSAAGLVALPPVLWLLQLVLPPLFEEILFRGLVLKELLAGLPRGLAFGLTSLLFVGVHLPFWLSHGGASPAMLANAGGVLVFSVVACWLYARSGSIWPPTLAHMANNMLSLLLVAGSR